VLPWAKTARFAACTLTDAVSIINSEVCVVVSRKPIPRHRGRADIIHRRLLGVESENGLGRRLARIGRRVRRNSYKRRGVEISQQ
jgi:hypothetical protein